MSGKDNLQSMFATNKNFHPKGLFTNLLSHYHIWGLKKSHGDKGQIILKDLIW